jgi:hypothetical protein
LDRTKSRQNKDKLYPSIFEKKINYAYLKKKMDVLREELIATSMHPKQLQKWIDMGGDIDEW